MLMKGGKERIMKNYALDVLKQYLTQKQIDLLCLLFPAPVGEGLTRVEAAERLGITISSIQKRLKNIRSKNPQIAKKLDEWEERAKKSRLDIENAVRVNKIESSINIRDKF